jgi:tetratricopeptide (TPR) repeat protein
LIRALDAVSESRESTFARGIELMQRHQTEAAIAAFERVLELDPDDAQAHYNLARAQIETGGLDQAEAHLRAAVAAWPEFFDAHLNLAILLGRSGRGEEAAEHIERAIAIDPEHVPTRMLHARVLAGRGDQRAAMTELEAILTLDPASIDARLALAQLRLEAGEVEAAKRQLEQVLAAAAASDHDRAQAHLRIARLPRTPPAEAAEHLRAAIELEPTSVEARGALAERLASAGRLDEAAGELSRLVDLAPDDPRARVGLATTLVLAGEYARARVVLDQGSERFPDHPALQHLLARLLATCPDPALRDGPRAVAIAEKLIEREPTIDYAETLAMALAEAGRFDDAIVWQRRAIEQQTASGANTVSSRNRLALYQAGRPAREPWNESVKAAAASAPPSPR